MIAAAAMLASVSAHATIKFERSWQTPPEKGGVQAVLALGNGESLASITFGGVVRFTPAGRKTFLPFKDKHGFSRFVDDMALAPDGTVYLMGSGEIARYRQDGRKITSWRTDYAEYPVLDVSPDGTVFLLADGSLKRFGPNGKNLGQWSPNGKWKNFIRRASSLAVDADGTVLIANDWNGSVRRFTPNGRHLGKFAATGWKPGQTFSPSLETDKSGHVFAFDWYLNRLQVFTSGGEFLRQFGRTGTGNRNFGFGGDFSVHADGQIVIEDLGTVRQYRLTDGPSPEYPAIAGWTLDWNRSARPGRTVKVPFIVVNYGTERAHGVRYCRPKYLYRSVLPAAQRCQKLGSLEAGQAKRFKVKVRAPRRSHPDFDRESSIDFEIFIRSKKAGFSQALGQIWPRLGRG